MIRPGFYGFFALAALLPASVSGQSAPLAPIEQTVLAKDAFSTGLLDRSAGALGSDIWRGADPGVLEYLLEMTPERPASPAIGSALRRVLLSAGDAPAGSSSALGGAKLIALARAGFFEEARQIDSLAAPSTDPLRAEAAAAADLLSGNVAAACDRSRRITTGLENPFWIRLRVVCYAASNELDAAELALGILRDSGRLDASDAAILTPLAAGGAPKSPSSPVDAVQLAALRLMKAPVIAELLDAADGGVLVAVARDANAGWKTRMGAAARAAAMGVIGSAELLSLYAQAPAELTGSFQTIRAMNAPELVRDRAVLIADEIKSAGDFKSLVAYSMLYENEIRSSEGVILPAKQAAEISLALVTLGDAVGAERWLASASAEIARGVPDEQLLRYIGIASAFSALDLAGADRVAAAANVSLEPRENAADGAAVSSSLAPVVAAAISAAQNSAAGESALAALAASDAASKGDPVAEAIVARSFSAAGLGDVVRRRAVERAVRGLFPEEGTPAQTETPTPASAPDAMSPRLKPKRSA
jgi:hypothetical protein